MKLVIILSVLVLVLATVAYGRSERQKRWGWLKKIKEDLGKVKDDVGGFLSDAADKAKEHLKNVPGHLDDLGDKARENLNKARDKFRDLVDKIKD